MKPVIALVGRPNVGKSTLFNRLTRSRDAIVADQPGLTRDRHYGTGRTGGHSYIVVDTGGLGGGDDSIDGLMARQARQAVREADVILFLVDGRDGLLADDETILEMLRASGKTVILVINKAEGLQKDIAAAEFQTLGIRHCFAISAAHNHGIGTLMESVLAAYPDGEVAEEEDDRYPGIRIAVVGRPNVGKSTLVNRLLGEERVIAFDQPGTTRDSIFIPFEHDGRTYTLIDTAGMRRRGRVADTIEKFSVIKTLQAIGSAHVVILVLDARQEIADQDARLLGMVLENGKALVIAVNKWDGLTPDERDRIRRMLDRKLSFVDFASIHFISALHGSGVGELYAAVNRSYESGMRKLSTPYLTRLLQNAVVQHPPPLIRGRRIKLRYAHQGGHNPPLIVIHGNQVDAVPDDYRRYLENLFRRELDLEGTPVRIEFRGGANPFQGRKNILTRRQVSKRKRLKRFLRRKNKP